jgi:hypothetical protein
VGGIEISIHEFGAKKKKKNGLWWIIQGPDK